jgi:di/tricarboxylate transporter
MPPDLAMPCRLLGAADAFPPGDTLHAWIAVGVLVAAMALFISKLIPLWVTALSIPVVLAATGTLEPAQVALAGFGNGAVIALAGVFILGAGLEATGVATIMGRGLERLGGRSEARIVVVIMVLTAVMSAFLSNAATVAVLLPAVAVVGRRTQIPVSRLMLPLAYAAILGGTLTLIGTTPNLILAEEMRKRVGSGLGVFEFAKIGAPVVVIGILYMATIGVRLLPKHRTQDRLRAAQVPEELARSYGFEGTLYRMRVVDQSHVVGKTLRDAEIGSRYQLDVILLFRPGAPLA